MAHATHRKRQQHAACHVWGFHAQRVGPCEQRAGRISITTSCDNFACNGLILPPKKAKACVPDFTAEASTLAKLMANTTMLVGYHNAAAFVESQTGKGCQVQVIWALASTAVLPLLYPSTCGPGKSVLAIRTVHSGHTAPATALSCCPVTVSRGLATVVIP